MTYSYYVYFFSTLYKTKQILYKVVFKGPDAPKNTCKLKKHRKSV